VAVKTREAERKGSASLVSPRKNFQKWVDFCHFVERICHKDQRDFWENSRPLETSQEKPVEILVQKHLSSQNPRSGTQIAVILSDYPLFHSSPKEKL